MAEIARIKNSARQGVQRIVNELVAEGIVETKPNPKHSRYPLVQLTAQGEETLQGIRVARRLWAEDLLAALGGELDPETLRFLERFQVAVKKTLAKR